MVSEVISRYRLPMHVLKEYLQGQFPTTTINVEEGEDDEYVVKLPQYLSQDQRAAIKSLQTEDE
ncbi:unnamed protein product [Clonostachys chloroleuca]|uniref:Uncharacterized protein n=1 Tax=Clonostachys chloroleuca TaxID=1926264 RepID=A0AA35M005_9HYPO|nr:unnamed protein product [Clonostachys chloroleuca]